MCALLLLAAGVQAQPAYLNSTAGGPLRPGVYGRISVGNQPPPPVIYPRPMIASQALVPAGVKPVYLYVPPGHARKWPKYCRQYAACDQPVYFVRMDNSPSKLGRWKSRAADKLAYTAPHRD
jgi:hypothetical protein